MRLPSPPAITILTCDRWLDKAARSCRESDEEFRACPNADCDWGCLMSTKADGNIFRCQMCKYRYCSMCGAPMHEDMTCEDYQAKLRREREEAIRQEEEASRAEVSKTTKQCPKCKSAIWKSGGCAHMTCMCRRPVISGV